MADRPTVLVACVRNAGRSQAAAALLINHAGNRIHVLSGGSEPAELVHPEVEQVLAERGLTANGAPRAWTEADVKAADVVVTMGCGDSCPYFPGKRYEDWAVEDPGGRELSQVRAIVDDIDRRVQTLLRSLGIPEAPAEPGDD